MKQPYVNEQQYITTIRRSFPIKELSHLRCIIASMKEQKELCPFVVPVQKGLVPDVPLCRLTGKNIAPRHASPTGFQKCHTCPVGNYCTDFCELAVSRKKFDERWGEWE